MWRVTDTVCRVQPSLHADTARFRELWFDVVVRLRDFIYNVFSFNDSEVRVFVWDTDYYMQGYSVAKFHCYASCLLRERSRIATTNPRCTRRIRCSDAAGSLHLKDQRSSEGPSCRSCPSRCL